MSTNPAAPKHIDAWWFCKRDPDGEIRLPNGDGRIVRVGETLSVGGRPVLCSRGLHASLRAYDALKYAPGPTLCRVRLSGKIAHGPDKLCATVRTCLAIVDASALLRTFAAGCALGALECERAAGREPDPRSWSAVDAAMRYAAGAITAQELSAAAHAAYAAAYAHAAYAAAYAHTADAAEAAYAAIVADAADAAYTDAAAYAAYAHAANAAYAADAADAAAYTADAAAAAAAAVAANAAAAYAADAQNAIRASHAASLERLCLEAINAGVWP